MPGEIRAVCYLCQITCANCFAPRGPWAPTPCTVTATCAGSPSGSRRATRSPASPAAAAPRPWWTGCCSPLPPTTSSAKVGASWQPLPPPAHRPSLLYPCFCMSWGSWGWVLFSQTSRSFQVVFSWVLPQSAGNCSTGRESSVPDAHTRLCNGMLAYRGLLELIGTNNSFRPVTYTPKIWKISGIIKT